MQLVHVLLERTFPPSSHQWIFTAQREHVVGVLAGLLRARILLRVALLATKFS